MKFSEIKDILKKSKNAVILSHRSPDGDSIGSSLAVYNYIKNYVEKVDVITPDKAPNFLNWISGFDTIITYDSNQEQSENILAKADLIFCLDFNTPSRMGDLADAFSKKSEEAVIINIDHHQEPDDFANFQLSDTSASSTCQLVFDFITELGDKKLITVGIAEAIYTGILTDTGSFRFSSTSKHTHNVVSELIEIGVTPSNIHSTIYDSYSINRLKLLGFALNERFNVYEEFSTGIIYLSESDLNQFHFQKGDTEGLVNYPLSVADIRVSILITEKDGKVKMSFRSKDNIRVNQIAKKYFNGGGHFNAAGGISNVSVIETVKKLEEILPKYKDEIHA